MDKIKELKNEAFKKLEEAIKKQEEIIAEQDNLINNCDKLKIGNVVECNIVCKKYIYDWDKQIKKNVLLIVDEPYIKDENIMIPVMGHIDPVLRSDTSFHVNPVKCVYLLSVPIDRLSHLRVISISEYLYGQKHTVKKDWNNLIDSAKANISLAERNIEESKKIIERNRKWLEEHDSVDVDEKYDDFVTNFIFTEEYKSIFENVKADDNTFVYEYSD